MRSAVQSWQCFAVIFALLAAPSSAATISDEAGRLIDRAGFTELLDLELHLTPAAEVETLGQEVTASFAVGERGERSYTLNGERVGEAELAAHSERTKRELLARAEARARRDQSRFEAAIRRAGLEGKVSATVGRVLRVRLNRDEARRAIEALGGELSLVDLPQVPRLTLTQATTTNTQGAFEATGIVPYAHSYGLKGSGVGVWLEEGNSPDSSDPAINTANLRYLTSDPVLGDHATLTTVTLQKAAPQAVVYYGHQPAGCHLLSSILTQTNPPIYLGSHSWNWGDVASATYTNCCAEWDDFVYENRLPMFVPSGGSAPDVYTTSPGKAFNVVAVGGADTDAGIIDGYSGYLNPETGAIKPDVVTPGTCLAIKPGHDCVSGVSIATPIAAGFAADMIGGSAFFRNQPQVVKAYLVAGATTDIEPGIAMDGPGMANFLHTWFYRWGKWWNGSNASYFNSNQEIIETTNLTAGKRYRVAISWLVPGSYALANKKPNMEMSLTVTRGTSTFTSNYSRSIFQWVDFVAPTSGSYTIKIKRTFNAGVGDLALALTVGEVV